MPKKATKKIPKKSGKKAQNPTKKAAAGPSSKSGSKSAASGAVRKEMTIGEVIEKYPESAPVMLQHGLHCIGCHVALWETVEQGASAHGIDPVRLVSDINKEIARKKQDS
jgi:hybrid cluster-associated redox disulfide protein